MKTVCLKAWSVLLMGTLILSVAGITASASANYVQNGSFESETGIVMSSGAVRMESGGSPDGGYCIAASGPQGTAQITATGLTACETYTMEVAVKSNADGAAAVSIEGMHDATALADYQDVDYTGSALEFYNHLSGTDLYQTTENKWRSIRTNFTLPEGGNAAEITLGCVVDGQTVYYDGVRVYPAENLISNGDFEGVGVCNTVDGTLNAISGTNTLLTNTTGTSGAWKNANGSFGTNGWGATHFTYGEGTTKSTYFWMGSGSAADSKLMQIVPVKAGQLYKLSFDWGVWHTSGGAPLVQIFEPATATNFTKQLVYTSQTDASVATKKWINTQYIFWGPTAAQSGMNEVAIRFADNGGADRITVDNVRLEPISTTIATAFSEGYEKLAALPANGNTDITVRNHYRLPRDAENAGTQKDYCTVTGVYKIIEGTAILQSIKVDAMQMTVAAEDIYKSVQQTVTVPAAEAGASYEIRSYTWDSLTSMIPKGGITVLR